jgi:hypothetical protein
MRGRRDWEMPTGPQGFVVEDLDRYDTWQTHDPCQHKDRKTPMLLRWHGSNFNLDALGRFRFCEAKYGMAGLETAQELSFGLITHELRHSQRFDGFYLVQYDDPAHGPTTTYWVNGWEMESWEFKRWLLCPWSTVERLRDPWGES